MIKVGIKNLRAGECSFCPFMKYWKNSLRSGQTDLKIILQVLEYTY